MKRWRIGLLGVGISLMAIYFVFSQIKPEDLVRSFQEVHWGYVLPCTLLLILGLFTRALRWRVLLDNALPLSRAFHMLNVAYLVNGILPLRMGEVARAFLATRYQPPVPVARSFSTIVIERLLDVLAVVVLLAFGLASGPLPPELSSAGLIGPVALIGFLGLVFLAARREFAEQLIDAVVGRLAFAQRWRLDAIARQFLDGVKPLTQPASLISTLLLTALSWGLSVAAGYVLMLGFWDHGSWSAAALFVAAASLAIAVPAVPGSLGTYEVTILIALNATGYGDTTGTASLFALAVHGLNLAVYALLGAIGFIREGISLSQLSEGVQQMRQTQQTG